MDPETKPQEPAALPPPKPTQHRNRMALAAALVAAGLVGAGATAVAQRNRQPVLVALTPAPVASMQDGNTVAVSGDVSEIFGNKFILADSSGHALIDTGRDGEGGKLVAKSETVTVQGRFDNGVVHAIAIRHGDGRTVVLGPSAPPPPPPPRPPLG